MLTSNEFAQQLGRVKPKAAAIANFIDLDEMVEGLGAAIGEA